MISQKVRVFIVDDEVEFAGTLAERLSLRGFDASVMESAEEALAALASMPRPDVILLDLKMPGMDGLDALGRIKACDSSIEVILVTGHGAVASGIDGMRKGAFDYLMKPIDIDEVAEKIRNAAGQRKPPR